MIDQVSIQQEKIVALEGTDTNLLSQIWCWLPFNHQMLEHIYN
jgi:hypothetical protein